MSYKAKPLTCYYCDEAFQPGEATGGNEDAAERWHVRCPSLDTPRPVGWCSLCDQMLQPGDRVGENGYDVWHISCGGPRGVLRARGVCEDAPCCGCCGVERWEPWESGEDDQ